MDELTCQQARSMVSDYMNSELEQGNIQSLEYHLQHCTSCPPLYASLVEVQRHLRQSRQTAPAPEVMLRIARKISKAIESDGV